MSVFAILLAISLIFGFSGRTSGGISFDSLCIFSSKDQVCYRDKEKDIKKNLDQLDKYYCIDEVDLRKITTKLQESKSE